jgi:phenylpropionate dioxygenase-like ring-hydroxylating dioxygenase large terminal subunit
MYVKRAWYVASFSRELTTKPIHRQLLGQHVALFRDSNGTARALSAICPHRGANLGQGRVIDGTLQCPFHGWRFNGEGRCIRIPSQTEGVPVSDKAVVGTYPVREQQGFIFLWMDPAVAPTHEPKTYDFFEDKFARGRQTNPTMIYEASFLNVVENALDGAHLPFVHIQSVGLNQDPVDPPIKISLDANGRGFEGKAERSRAADSRPLRNAGLFNRIVGYAPMRKTLFRFDLGGFVYFDTEYMNDTREVILAFITPLDAQKTWFFAESVRTRGLNPLGDYVQRRFMHHLLTEDEKAVTLLLPPAAGVGGLPHPVFVSADKQTVAFRKVYGDALRAEGHTTVPWAQSELDPSYLAPSEGRAAAE